MNRFPKTLAFFLVVALISVSAFAQRPNRQATQTSISGRVLDKDGETPLKDVEVRVEELFVLNGAIEVERTISTKTDGAGRYLLTGVNVGRARVLVLINRQVVRIKGEKLGDEIFLSDAVKTINFDLSKAPAGK